MDPEIGGDLLQGDTVLAVLCHTDHIVTQPARIGLRHEDHSFQAHPRQAR